MDIGDEWSQIEPLKGLIVMEKTQTGYTVEYVVNGQRRLVHIVKQRPEILKNPGCYVALKNLVMLEDMLINSYLVASKKISENPSLVNHGLFVVNDISEVLHLEDVFADIEDIAVERLESAGVTMSGLDTAIGTIANCVENGEVTDDNLKVMADLIIEYTSLFRLFMGVNPKKLEYSQDAVDVLGENIAEAIRDVYAQPRTRAQISLSV